mgnify:CR=1 FL=1
MRSTVRKIIQSIHPLDDLEKEHIADAVAWIDSGEEIFRIQKPDTPPKHLVSYFVLADVVQRKILLLDHLKAERWLPSGGHVEPNEHPKTTVKREIVEELNQRADFLLDNPIFITQTVTVGKTAGHKDVSLWYVLEGDSEVPVSYDQSEFNGYKWFGYEEVLNSDLQILDPHMHRFVRKFISLTELN